MSEKATYTPPPTYEQRANNAPAADQPALARHVPVELSSEAEIQTLPLHGTGIAETEAPGPPAQSRSPGPQISPSSPRTSGPPGYERPADTPVPVSPQPPQEPQQQDRGVAEGPITDIELQNLPPQQNTNNAGEQNGIRQAPEPWNPDPRMYPPQPYGQPQQPAPSQYQTAYPIYALQRASLVVDCPICNQREMTRAEAVSGNSTHGWAAVLCCCICLGCIPYMVASFKDMQHSCGKCGHLLATYHSSGHTEVHQQQKRQQEPKKTPAS